MIPSWPLTSKLHHWGHAKMANILPKLSGENPNCPHMFHQAQERLVREKEAPQQITSLDNQEASF